jgi:hypothetical protein
MVKRIHIVSAVGWCAGLSCLFLLSCRQPESRLIRIGVLSESETQILLTIQTQFNIHETSYRFAVNEYLSEADLLGAYEMGQIDGMICGPAEVLSCENHIRGMPKTILVSELFSNELTVHEETPVDATTDIYEAGQATAKIDQESFPHVAYKNKLLVHRSIQSINDLKGKRIGVEFRTSTHISLLGMLKKVGISPNEVLFIDAHPSDFERLLQAESIQAALVPNSVKSEELQGRPFHEIQPVNPIVDISVFAMNAKIVKDDSRMISRLITYWEQARSILLAREKQNYVYQDSNNSKETHKKVILVFNRFIRLVDQVEYFQEGSPLEFVFRRNWELLNGIQSKTWSTVYRELWAPASVLEDALKTKSQGVF